jgi:membrane protease YdiL (CAAX protease family)
MIWWVPVVAVVVLATTTVSVILGRGHVTPWIAVTVSLVGYAMVWWNVRPAPLSTGPHTWLTTDGLARDRTDPPTLVIPAAVARRHRRPGRAVLLLLSSAAVGLGLSVAWALVIGIAMNPPLPEFDRASTAMGALTAAVGDSVITSVLEECGIALLILAVAGIAQRYLPTRYDDRTVAVYAILIATAARTALHVPLWGIGALGRVGLSLVLAWLFWRTRRVWPLILAHIIWDTLALQAAVSPSFEIAALSALIVLGWGITGTVIAIVAMVRSRRNIQYANHYYTYRPPPRPVTRPPRMYPPPGLAQPGDFPPGQQPLVPGSIARIG